jgi:comEA protein
VEEIFVNGLISDEALLDTKPHKDIKKAKRGGQWFFVRPMCVIVGLSAAFLLFIFGYFLGHRFRQESFFIELEKGIPAAVESAYTRNEGTVGEKININTASEEELCRLNGIGPVLAKRIQEYRDIHGDFSHPYEIMNVTGIGTAVYEKILTQITVN